MTVFKKISGNYVEVLAKAGLPENLADVGNDALATIQKDLPRGPFVDVNGRTTASLRETWENTTVSHAYTQGNMNASVFSLINLLFFLKLPTFINQTMGRREDDRMLMIFEKEELCFAYYDDLGIPSGFSIVYNKNDPSLWTATSISNTTEAPEERIVTTFCHEDMIINQGDQTFEGVDVCAALLQTIKSKSVQQLLNPILGRDGHVDLAVLAKLQKRIRSDRNIDDRDVRKPQLEELITVVRAQLPRNIDLDRYLQDISARSLVDLDFFQDDNFDSTLNDIFHRVEEQVGYDNDTLSGKGVIDVCRLTLHAIQCELSASKLINSADSFRRGGLLMQSSRLRERRSVLPLIIENTSDEGDSTSMVDEGLSGTTGGTPLSSTLEQMSYGELADEALGVLSQKIEYKESALKLGESLLQIGKTDETQVEARFYSMGTQLFQLIQDLEQDDPELLGSDGLILLNNVLQVCSSVISHPQSTSNKAKFKKLSETLSEKDAPQWLAIQRRLHDFESFDFEHLASIIDYKNNIKRFEVRLDDLFNDAKLSAIGKNFHGVVDNVLTAIKSIVGSDPSDLDAKRLAELNDILKAYSAVINDPKKIYIETLKTRSQNLSDKVSPQWVVLDEALKRFSVLNVEHIALEIEHEKNINIFHEKLAALTTASHKSLPKQKLCKQGNAVLDIIKTITENNLNTMKIKDLSELNQVLKGCSDVIDDQKDVASIRRLEELSQIVSGKASPFWKTLGAALIIFTAIALVVAGVLGAIPTAGTSLLLTAGGAAALTTTGFFAIKQGLESGLAKSVSGFGAAGTDVAEEGPEVG